MKSLEEYKYLIPEESSGVVTENVKELRKMESILRKIFDKFEYTETLVPLFEYIELYKRVYSDFDEEKSIKYIGKDGNVIALRWDFTIPIVRHYFSQNTDKEARYSYFGKVYRKEKAYNGKSNENYQAGIELINVPGTKGNIEVLEILQNALKDIKLSNLKIELGSAKFFNRICELTGNKDKLIEILSKKNISEMEKFVNQNQSLNERVKNLLLKLPRLFGDINMLNEIIISVKDKVIINALEELKNTYNKLECKDNVIFDLSMCPTMQYYTCLMFKVYSPYSPEPIVSGGRYDLLYKNFKKDVPAVGMGIYLSNILNALEKEGEK